MRKDKKASLTAAVHTSNDLNYFVHESTNKRGIAGSTELPPPVLMRASFALLESRLDRYLVLNGRLVHVSEFFEILRGHRLQLLGSQVLSVDGALAWRRWIVFRADLTSALHDICLLYTSPSPRDKRQSRMPSSA